MNPEEPVAAEVMWFPVTSVKGVRVAQLLVIAVGADIAGKACVKGVVGVVHVMEKVGNPVLGAFWNARQ